MKYSTRTARLNLTAEEWRSLGIRAAEQEKSVAAYLTEVVRQHLQATAKSQGRKRPSQA